jgi:hypothetical protein
MVKLRYISDIHLEFLKIFPEIQNLDYENESLCLLGDIGYAYSQIYHDFIEYCSDNWKNVFVIMGNHEFYCLNKNIKTMSEIEKCTEQFKKNVYFLNNKSILLDKITNEVVTERSSLNVKSSLNVIKIIGSILWSDINKFAETKMNDYRMIYTRYPNTRLTSIETKQFFQINKLFILDEINNDLDIKCVLLTHHGIHNEICNDYYAGGKLTSAYATTIHELTSCKNLIAAINGHTHANINSLFPNTKIRLLANCYGYKGERQDIVKYKKDAILEI